MYWSGPSCSSLCQLAAPPTWLARMSSIKSADEDASFQGRVAAWKTSLAIAKARLTGGGAGDSPSVERDKVAEAFPVPGGLTHGRAAHSIYFEVLGDHGVVGLVLYLLVIAAAALNTVRVQIAARGRPDLAWASSGLAKMLRGQHGRGCWLAARPCRSPTTTDLRGPGPDSVAPAGGAWACGTIEPEHEPATVAAGRPVGRPPDAGLTSAARPARTRPTERGARRRLTPRLSTRGFAFDGVPYDRRVQNLANAHWAPGIRRQWQFSSRAAPDTSAVT